MKRVSHIGGLLWFPYVIISANQPLIFPCFIGAEGPSPDSGAVSFQPPHLHLTLTRLPSCQSSRDVFDRIFACHHYMEACRAWKRGCNFFLGGHLSQASEKECSKRKGILSSCGECDWKVKHRCNLNCVCPHSQPKLDSVFVVGRYWLPG